MKSRVSPHSGVLPADDPLLALKPFTQARIALGRAGVALPTRAHLAFQADHARAREAVWSPLDDQALTLALVQRGFDTLTVASRAADRSQYLRRPDLGRQLADGQGERLATLRCRSSIALVVADGLSAEAVRLNALPVTDALRSHLYRDGIRLDTAVVARQGRVAIGDPIGEALVLDVVVVLIGERPGLSAADSLGAYISWKPRSGMADSQRNCVSNIRAGGLAPEAAASKIAWLVRESMHRRVSGIALKDGSAGGLNIDNDKPAIERPTPEG